MSDSFYDAIVVIFLIVIPIVLLALHILFCTRKKLALGFIVPGLWTLIGVIMVMKADYFPLELGIFFGGVLLILLGILFAIKKFRKK